MENITIIKIDRRYVLQSIQITFLISTLVAIFNSLVISNTTFLIQFLASQSIGLTIVTIMLSANIFFPLKGKFQYQYYLLPFPVLIATLISINFLHEQVSFGELYLVILIISLPSLLVFHYRHSTIIATASIEEEKNKRELSEKQLLESKLLLLQAQINPHFLFNTLANIDAYIDISPNDAKILLQNYTHFLRHSLKTTQSMQGSIADEVNLLNAYMRIQQTRFPKIQFEQKIDNNLLNLSIAPLLIQPLIENAIIHGLAPQGNQGVIILTIEQAEQQLLITVADNGVGLNNPKSHNMGIAINNIQSRLQLYTEKSSVSLVENNLGGVNAQLSIPLRD